MKKLNQKEYADIMGIKQQAVQYRLKVGAKLPGVTRIEKFSRFYVLHYNEKTNVEEAKGGFKGRGKV
jgi:hypothetical protein